MEGVLVVGAGRVAFPKFDDEGNVTGIEWVGFPLVAVTHAGVVMYQDEDGHQHVSHGVDAEITEVEWSAFDQLTDLAAKRDEPSCARCGDSDVTVKRMVPPVCPQCFRGAPRRSH